MLSSSKKTAGTSLTGQAAKVRVKYCIERDARGVCYRDDSARLAVDHQGLKNDPTFISTLLSPLPSPSRRFARLSQSRMLLAVSVKGANSHVYTKYETDNYEA